MIREFKKEDLVACVALVNKIWDFDHKFQPHALSALFKIVYTAGSLAESNFYLVVEKEHKVRFTSRNNTICIML